MALINPGFMSIIIADCNRLPSKKRGNLFIWRKAASRAAERRRWSGNKALTQLHLFPFSTREKLHFPLLQQHDNLENWYFEKLCFVRDFGTFGKGARTNASPPWWHPPLLLLSRPPYIAAGKQMSGHKYAHKLQGKKAVGGAVGVASTGVRTVPRIFYTYFWNIPCRAREYVEVRWVGGRGGNLD